jgi:LDH2 family malate/lactate/ureidoglycolate dehydrogenase
MPASYATHRKQLQELLLAWGMPADNAARTADVMAYADLHGIDSHGISLVPGYYTRSKAKRVNIVATPKIVRETPVSALIDGGGGFGHVTGRFAMETAIDKAKAAGVGIASVRNSVHFGACGFYAKMAADAGLIGMVTTSAGGVQVAPTRGAEAKLGTDPLAFGAPGRDGEPFLLDMATTTVAAGRIRNKANEGLQCPPGWVLTKQGLPSTDPEETSHGGFMTSLGGSEESSSYKGYGLAGMVNILASCLSGASLITDPMHTKRQIQNIGHFFMAIDPGMFRDPEEFRADVITFCDSLRAAKPVDPDRPVLVAGDPERANAKRRMQQGIPVGKNLLQKVRAIAEECGAPWLLGD